MAIIDQGNCDNTATAALKYGIFNVYWDRASELGSGFYDRNSDIHIQQPQSPPYSLDYSLDTNAARICLPYTAAHSHSLPKFRLRTGDHLCVLGTHMVYKISFFLKNPCTHVLFTRARAFTESRTRGGVGMLPPVKSRVTVVGPRTWSNTQPLTRILIRERLSVQVSQNDAFEDHAMFHLDPPPPPPVPLDRKCPSEYSQSLHHSCPCSTSPPLSSPGLMWLELM